MHVKTEPEVLTRDIKREAKQKVEKYKSNTDSENGSNLDDEKTKIDDSSPKKRSKYRVNETFTATDEKEENKSSNTKSVRDLSGKKQKFDLEEEAKDLWEMISAREEEEQVPKETMRKLHGLRVTLKHAVPPQHQVETCAGSRGPTPKQKEIMESFGPIKYGKFTPEEDEIIVNNWKSFCKMHNWDPRDVRPFLYMRHQHVGYVTKFAERQKFVQFLADGLSWRTLYSVYWRFRNLYQPHLQTRYTEDEDKLIIAHMENSSAIDTKNVRKFSELAKILNRTRASVWRRYRLLKKKRNPYGKVNWDMHLVKKMIKNLMRLTSSDDVHQLKDLSIPLVIWKKLSEKFKIDDTDLKDFWLSKLHMQLFCEEPLYLNDVKIKLIEYFYVTGITQWWEIQWPNIVKHFDGMTSIFLAQIFYRLVHDDKLQGLELNEILENLYQVKRPQLQKASADICLPRIIFENGNVKLLDITTNNRRKRRTFAAESSDSGC